MNNYKTILCKKYLYNNSCDYNNKCSFVHTVKDQKINEYRKNIIECMDGNMSKTMDINDEKYLSTLWVMTNLCNMCVNNKCCGGYNCKNGICCKKYKVCKNDFINGECCGVLSNNRCNDGYHLTICGFIPYNIKKNYMHIESIVNDVNEDVKVYEIRDDTIDDICKKIKNDKRK